MGGTCSKRRNARRRTKRFWAAALCAAGFVTGQMLFGEDPQPGHGQEPPSLMSQYLQSISQIAVEMNGGRQANRGPESADKSQNAEAATPKAESRIQNSERRTSKSIVRHAEPPSGLKDPSASPLVEAGPQAAPEHVPAGEILKIPTPRLLTREAKSAAQEEEKSVTPASAQAPEEKLAPIVPAWAMPRPGTKNPAPPSAQAVVKQETIQKADEAAIKSGKTIAFGPTKPTDPISSPKPANTSPPIQPLRIELGGPQTASPAVISIPPKPLPTPTTSPPPLPSRNPPAGTHVVPVEKSM